MDSTKPWHKAGNSLLLKNTSNNPCRCTACKVELDGKQRYASEGHDIFYDCNADELASMAVLKEEGFPEILDGKSHALDIQLDLKTVGGFAYEQLITCSFRIVDTIDGIDFVKEAYNFDLLPAPETAAVLTQAQAQVQEARPKR